MMSSSSSVRARVVPVAPVAAGAHRLLFLAPLLLLVLPRTTATAAAARRAPTDRPNFLLHFVDDLGYGDLGVTGSPTAATPHIDAYASRGRRLAAWYSGYPVCSASRTALLTGRHPPRVGMPGVINSLGVEGLPQVRDGGGDGVLAVI